MEINSNRKFKVQISSLIVEDFTIDLDEIINNPDALEVIYAMNEILDKILDLKLNESMYFQPNRDNNKSKGIITRLSF